MTWAEGLEKVSSSNLFLLVVVDGCWPPTSYRRLSHRVPRGQLLLAAPKDSLERYHKHNNNKYQRSTDVGLQLAIGGFLTVSPGDNSC